MAYSDGEKAEALIRLAINQYDFKKTAEQTGITAKTLRIWNKNVPKNSVSDLLNRAIEKLLVSIPQKMSGQDWAVALGILMDKWLLMQGEPTARTESIQRQVSALTDDEYDDLLEQADNILRESKRGSGASAAGADEPD